MLSDIQAPSKLVLDSPAPASFPDRGFLPVGVPYSIGFQPLPPRLFTLSDHIGEVTDMIFPVSAVLPVDHTHYHLDNGLLLLGPTLGNEERQGHQGIVG